MKLEGNHLYRISNKREICLQYMTSGNHYTAPKQTDEHMTLPLSSEVVGKLRSFCIFIENIELVWWGPVIQNLKTPPSQKENMRSVPF